MEVDDLEEEELASAPKLAPNPPPKSTTAAPTSARVENLCQRLSALHATDPVLNLAEVLLDSGRVNQAPTKEVSTVLLKAAKRFHTVTYEDKSAVDVMSTKFGLNGKKDWTLTLEKGEKPHVR